MDGKTEVDLYYVSRGDPYRPQAVRSFGVTSFGTSIVVVAWLASGYVWILPLFQPRGIYGWGHYEIRDFYVRVPLLVVTGSLPSSLGFRTAHMLGRIAQHGRRAVCNASRPGGL